MKVTAEEWYLGKIDTTVVHISTTEINITKKSTLIKWSIL